MEIQVGHTSTCVEAAGNILSQEITNIVRLQEDYRRGYRQPMKICLNALHFAPGHMGGTETYFRELIRHIPLVGNDDDSIVVFTNSRYHEEFSANEGISIEHIAIYERPDPRWFMRAILRKGFGIDLQARALARVKADIIHYPFSLLDPPVSDKPTVLTFWDMQQEFYPQFFTKKEREHRAKTYKKSVHLATRVIVSAEFTKQCLVDLYAVDKNKIDVVYTGYSHDYQASRSVAEIDFVRQKYDLDRPFMFYPAATWPHKNHLGLLNALRLLIDRHNFDGMLVLSGIAMQQHNALLEALHELRLSKHVKVLGYLPYATMPCLFNMARLLVFPSLFEGFGMPLVEAMASGCPVVASNCTSIPEVVGDAGTLFDPNSIEDIAETLWSVWNNDQQLIAMREKGLHRVTKFTWEETARRTHDVYNKIV